MNTIGSYKGNPTISLGSERKYPFTFGLAKAQQILANYNDIVNFVKMHESTATAPTIDRHDMAVEDQMALTVGR